MKFHNVIHHMFSDKMIYDVYVLGPGMLYSGFSVIANCTCIVTED